MGIHGNITSTKYPAQGSYLGRRVSVCFHYDAGTLVPGTLVRDDVEDPWRTIIRLDDGRHVLSTECQWSPTQDADRPDEDMRRRDELLTKRFGTHLAAVLHCMVGLTGSERAAVLAEFCKCGSTDRGCQCWNDE